MARSWNALFSTRTMDGIMVGAWLLSSQNGLGHGRHHGWEMDAFCPERIRPWTSSWLDHGSRGDTAKLYGLGTANKGNTVSTEGLNMQNSWVRRRREHRRHRYIPHMMQRNHCTCLWNRHVGFEHLLGVRVSNSKDHILRLCLLLVCW